MATNFIVNKHDLDFILKQIRISEDHASGTTLPDAIRNAYGVDAEDATLLPAGLRTVDGRENNLLPGRADYGAAQTTFPRLLDPVYTDDQDGDSIDFDGQGPSPAITNTDYGLVDGQGHVGTGSVVDADPRIISNLIVTQDVSNPAAVRAALKVAGVEGAAQTAAVNAITAAYEGTLNANGASVEVAAAQAVVTQANAANAAASDALDAAVAEVALYTAGLSAAEAVPALITTAQTAADALISALNAIPAEEPVDPGEFIDPEPQIADYFDQPAYDTAHEAWANSDLSAPEPQPGDFTDQAGFDTAHADWSVARDAHLELVETYDAARATYDAALGTAAGAYVAAMTASGNAEVAAGAVVTALGDSPTAEALALQDLATNLRVEIGAVAAGSFDPSDAAAVAAALEDFDGALGAAQDSVAELDGLKDAAEQVRADAQSDADAAAAALQQASDALAAAQAAADTSGTPQQAAANLQATIEAYGLEIGEDGGIIIENRSPDIGLSPSFNTAMTIFGQFFDHGLDLVNKGGNGTVYIPLQPDDPLIAGADKIFGTADDLPKELQFMTLTRATPTWDADGTAQHENVTTPWVDQNQTYTSHASHQVFLREHVRQDVGDGTKAYSTGHLLDGKAASGNKDGALANWGEVKAQALEMLGIRLQDHDAHRVPLLKTDQYGNLMLGANGYAQMVMAPDAEHDTMWLKEGTAAGITTDGSMASGVAFLVDIARNAVPTDLLDENGSVRLVDHDRNPGTPPVPTAPISADSDGTMGNNVPMDNRGQITQYDNELLDAHFISGDGRGNENIGLTGIHTVFHTEHNRVVEANKHTILETGDRAFINEWLLVDLAQNQAIPTDIDDVVWDGARLFQAGRFSTEMQYQHMVFEEFARRIQPFVDPFVFTNTADIDGSIVAEFAHTVYRFGHSMLNGSVDRLGNDLGVVGGDDQLSLIEAFLNPAEYLAGGNDIDEIQGALLRGMSRDVGNEIDEFVVPALQSNLLGLPLDLAALNIARGRETGVPSLNETRAQLYNDFGLPDLKPYESWNDFVQNIKNPLSIINFVAAYGTHETIASADTLDDRREAATLLVLGGEGAPQDRMAFLNGTGAYAAEKGGLDNVDLWIGGLAERLNEFGGMLGSTFNFIFEYQMEQLQNGDRFYYLSRTQGLNMLNQLEQNTFTDIVMRNSDLGDKYATHLNGHMFVTPDLILELDRGIAQEDYDPDNLSQTGIDPVWDDPMLESLNPKVVREYSGQKADGNHDVGGSIKFRGGEHVVLGGTEGNDTLMGDLGIDALWGDGGDDYLNAGQESDEVFGGDGDDVIEDPFGDNFLRGNAGNDVISTARGFTLAFGNEGDDAIFLGQDAAEAFGDEGDDFILGSSGPDLLQGGEGSDWIEGGEGFDVMSGENSELFFNSTIIGHDVLWGQGNDVDYDLESGDDIALSGIGVQRMEGMFGFDWSTAKFDVAGVNHDMGIPFFTTDQQEILRDRFDQMEALSGWRYDDILSGDDRGQLLGGVGPGAEAEARFTEHVLTQEGIDRIDGLEEWLDGARATLFGAVPGADISSFRDGNILMGGNGDDVITGRGGFDLIDGDAWLNVRIRIMVDGTEYTAESLNSDTLAAGPRAGKVYAVDPETGIAAEEPSFGGRSLKSLLIDRTVKPGDMSIVREIKSDETPGDNIDTAVFRGTFAEYDIEGRGVFVDFSEDGDYDDFGEDVAQAAYDVNGDGFISVTDRDDGNTGAIVDGQQLQSRNQLTDDTDLVKNVELLRFSDQTIDIRALTGENSSNQAATGDVRIADPTTLLGGVTPFVGQVLSVSLLDFADADGVPIDENGMPVGLQFEWQSLLGGKQTWTTVATNQTEYTVSEADTEGSLRAVATFKDENGITERIYSAVTATPTVPFTVAENAAPGTVVVAQVPQLPDEDSGQFHQIQAPFDAGGRFDIVQSGLDAQGVPTFQIVVAGGLMDYELQDADQIVDNQYQIVVDTYDLDPALGGTLVGSREMTILLEDVVNEAQPTQIGFAPTILFNNTMPGVGESIGVFGSENAGAYTLEAGSSSSFTMDGSGNLVVASSLRQASTHILNVGLDTDQGAFKETFNLRIGRSTVADSLTGTTLDDMLYGLAQNDQLIGGAGDDALFGGSHDDRLFGETGNDTLVGSRGGDRVEGGDGDDTVVWTVGDGADVTDGGAGTDTMALRAEGGNQTLSVVFDGTSITGVTGAGDIANMEIFTVDMGAGTDTLSFRNSTEGVSVDLTAGTASGFASIAGVENVDGSNLDNVMTGDEGANRLRGFAGDDTFVATVDDAVDAFLGGGGSDTADYSAYDTDLTVDLSTNPGVVLGSGSSAATADTLTGVFNFIGGSGNDTILGRNGTNDLRGGAGNDTIAGKLGLDLLTGGEGADTFVFSDVRDSRGANTDVILDFEGAGEAGGDLLDFSALFGGGGFEFLGQATQFGLGVANQIRFDFTAGDTMVYVDNDNDRGVEAQVRLAGEHLLAASDFFA